MPVIARFYGILIKMYFREHGVPHFHAIYGEYNGVFDIETLEMIEGEFTATRSQNDTGVGANLSKRSPADVANTKFHQFARFGVI